MTIIIGTSGYTSEVRAIADEYQKLNPHVTIEIQNLSGQVDQNRAKLLVGIAGGSAPHIMAVDGPWLPEFASQGLLGEAPRWVEADLNRYFIPPMIDYVRFRGKTYGYPFQSSSHALYFNKTLFSQAGIPDLGPRVSWEDFVNIARRLSRTDASGQVVQAGFLANPRLFYFMDFLYNTPGANVLNEQYDGELSAQTYATIDSEESLRVWQFWHDLYHVNRVGSSQIGDHNQNFSRGTNAMMIIYNNAIVPLSQAGLDFGVTALPTQLNTPLTTAGGWILAVGAHVKGNEREEAWRFAQFLSTRESMLRIVKASGNLPARRDLLVESSIDPRMLTFVGLLAQGARPRVNASLKVYHLRAV